jgi:DMSO/TMAO reductase YedYZ molybdopterin-dependent catalytic subunit
VRVRIPRPEDFHAPAHTPAVTARVGLWLGVAFGLCFVTGLLSHAAQHPPGWFTWPTRPVSLYRVTQGVHVLSGIVAIPLLLAKLWSVYPRLFLRPTRPLGRHFAGRLSVLVLLCAAFFQLATGMLDVAQAYPWRFFFIETHYAVGWVAAGALAVHVAVKLPVARDGLAVRPDADRRAFLRTAWAASTVALLGTAGIAVPWLGRVSALAWRAPGGPQGLPINRTAVAAGVQVPADWRLEVVWPGARHAFTLEQLGALPQRTETLPIACVEGWSATARWTGVRVRDLLAAAGAPAGRPLRVTSLERAGLYAVSTLPAPHVADPLTLLALRVNGQVLDADHGFPCRIIAPSRPGVLQTKWVTRLEVLP